MAVLEIDELSMIEKLVLAHIHLRLQQWRKEIYHPKHCLKKSHCVCGARLPFGGVKVILAGDFGQLPPVAVLPDRTLLNAQPRTAGYDRQDANLGLRLFQGIRFVFRLRRIHRQVGTIARCLWRTGRSSKPRVCICFVKIVVQDNSMDVGWGRRLQIGKIARFLGFGPLKARLLSSGTLVRTMKACVEFCALPLELGSC